jgi:tRNA (uracil-5-)-methyltransferase
MRANFNVWRDQPKDDTAEGMYYAMFDKEQVDEDAKKSKNARGVPCEVKHYPHGTKKINTLMTQWLEALKEHPILCVSLFEARFLTTQTDDAVIVVCYKKPLTADWQVAADAVAAKLQVKIVGRSRKLKLVAGGGETVEEVLNVHGRSIKYYQQEGAFSQPNAQVCEKMLEWSMDATANSGDSDLLELYCGGGTFTAALAANFRRVLATEMSKASVELAHKAFTANHIDNIKIARLSSEEFTEAWEGKRPFVRLADAGIKFDEYTFSTVFVDPPRAGMDALTCALCARFDKIVYISCNPVTLARDLKLLGETHDAVRTACFDQFPYSHHLESGVVLVKRAVVGDKRKAEGEAVAEVAGGVAGVEGGVEGGVEAGAGSGTEEGEKKAKTS